MAYNFASLWVTVARLIFEGPGALAELIARGNLANGDSVTLRPSSDAVNLRACRCPSRSLQMHSMYVHR